MEKGESGQADSYGNRNGISELEHLRRVLVLNLMKAVRLRQQLLR